MRGPALVAVAVVALVAVVVPSAPTWPSGGSGGGDVALPAPTPTPDADDGGGAVAAGPGDASVACLEVPDCLAWEVPVPTDDPTLAAVEIGVASVAIATAGELTLVDAWTGVPRWTRAVDLAQPPSVALAEGLVVAAGASGGLVVHVSDDGHPLTVRETPAATSGAGAVTQARRYDGRVAVVRAAEAGGQQLVVVDVATGTSASVSRRAAHVVLARSGPVLHLGGGRLEARDAVVGTARWTSELAWEPVELVALGDTVVALGSGGVAILSAATGAPLVAEDEVPSGELATTLHPGEGLLVSSGPVARFVDRSGRTWEATFPERCCRGMSLTEDVVTVLLHDGRTVALSRADGRVRPTPTDAAPVPARSSLLDGGLLVEPQVDVPGWTVLEARTSRAVAVVEGALVGSTRDGALVVATGPSVAAIARPHHAEPPRRYGFARRCSSGAPGGCGFGG